MLNGLLIDMAFNSTLADTATTIKNLENSMVLFKALIVGERVSEQSIHDVLSVARQIRQHADYLVGSMSENVRLKWSRKTDTPAR